MLSIQCTLIEVTVIRIHNDLNGVNQANLTAEITMGSILKTNQLKLIWKHSSKKGLICLGFKHIQKKCKRF